MTAFVFADSRMNVRSSSPMRIGGIRSGEARIAPRSYAADAHQCSDAHTRMGSGEDRIAPRSYAADAHRCSHARIGARFREYEARGEAA
jgi:hypothetical protein